MPAWSPDGEWIAFAQYERIASQVIHCIYIFNEQHACSERRIIHHHDDPRVVLVRADGTDRVALGDLTGTTGTDPAWSPDGRHVYVSSTEPGYTIISRIDVETFAFDVIEGTEGGIEPAVSPDGRRLAFARPGDAGHDIWVVDLP
jgi:Tol biopolymer transport system component